MSYTPQHLKRWTRPQHYFGASWPEFFAVYGQHRDSDALTRSNFACIVKALRATDAATDRYGERMEKQPPAIIVRESHWAVGWVEWVGVKATAEATLRKADEIARRLEGYPVVNEDHFSELEWSEASEFWERMSVRERAEIIRDRGGKSVSIFAARRAEIPQDDSGSIFEYLRG